MDWLISLFQNIQPISLKLSTIDCDVWYSESAILRTQISLQELTDPFPDTLRSSYFRLWHIINAKIAVEGKICHGRCPLASLSSNFCWVYLERAIRENWAFRLLCWF